MTKSLVEIAIGNARSRLRSEDDFAQKDADSFLSFFAKQAIWDRRYKLWKKDVSAGSLNPRGWNGVVHIYDKKSASFPAGLTDRMVRHLETEGYEVKTYDSRKVPKQHPSLVDGHLVGEVVNRDWQESAFAKMQRQPRGFIEAATGAGKTTLIARAVAELGVTTLIIVNRSTLITQAVERFQNTIVFPHAENPFGAVGDNIWEPGLITVANYQTLYSMLKADEQGMLEWLKQFKAFHMDECHHAPARTMTELTDALHGAYYRYGHSATPTKDDKATELWLVGATGEPIHTYDAAQAIEDKVLVPPKIRMVEGSFPRLEPWDRVDEEKRYIGRFDKEYKTGLVEHIERNHLVIDLAKKFSAQKLPTLILVTRKTQGRLYESRIPDSLFLDGTAPTSEREEAKRQLTSGRLSVIIATTIFDEGEDVPAIGALILAGGYKASHKTMQRVGRGLRPSKGKKFVIVIDFWDGHSFRLENHSRERMKTFKKAKFKDIRRVTVSELAAEMKQKGFYS